MSQPNQMTTLEIETLTRHELGILWRKRFKKPVPTTIGTSMMRKILIFETQAQHYGRIDNKTQAAIKAQQTVFRNEKKTDNKDVPAKSITHTPLTGTKLLREWNGITHQIEVIEDGFLYQEQHYRPLSKINKIITGTHWSGPRFFGLNSRSESK